MDDPSDSIDDLFPLLAAGLRIFELGPIIVGQIGEFVDKRANTAVAIGVDGLSIWKNDCFMSTLGAAGTSILFFGGRWLEEDILISAIQAAILGYDVRVLVDLSKAKCETERKPALDRLAQYGVLQSTVRQVLLEWAVALDDPGVSDRVRALLSKSGASAQA